MIPFHRIRHYLFTGIAVLLPIALTLMVFNYIWRFVDHTLVGPIYEVLPLQINRGVAILLIKSLIFVLLIIAICLVGFATRIIFVREFITLGDAILARIPMVNQVYSTLKEISTVIFDTKRQKEMFRSTVLVEYPVKNSYAIAFVTNTNPKAISTLCNQEMISVFMPTTPNPTTGFLLYLPKSAVIELPMSVEEAIKLVISAGTIVGFQKAQSLKDGHAS